MDMLKTLRFSSVIVILSLLSSLILFDVFKVKTTDASVLRLPEPNQMLAVSENYSFPLLKGIKINPQNPLNLKFLVDSTSRDTVTKEEAQKLVEYFMAALTVPEADLWVNLSPYENDRIATESLGQTELGKDLLAQDYILKQLSSSLTNPNSDLGKKYWNKISANDTFNKIWIVPEKAEIYENNNFVFITEATLDVQTEADYFASELNGNVGKLNSESTENLILPMIKKELNTGKNFAKVRQMYHSIVLAICFKRKVMDSFYRHYLDNNKINGIDLEDKTVKEKIWNLYCESFKKGVYNVINKEKDSSTNEIVKRSYFSGGQNYSGTSSAIAIQDINVSELSTYIKNNIYAIDTRVEVAASAIKHDKNGITENLLSSSITDDDYKDYLEHNLQSIFKNYDLDEIVNDEQSFLEYSYIEYLVEIVKEYEEEIMPKNAHDFLKDIVSTAFLHEATHVFAAQESYQYVTNAIAEVLSSQQSEYFHNQFKRFKSLAEQHKNFSDVIKLITSGKYGDAKPLLWSAVMERWESLVDDIYETNNDIYSLIVKYRNKYHKIDINSVIMDKVEFEYSEVSDLEMLGIDKANESALTLKRNLHYIVNEMSTINEDRLIDLADVIKSKLKIYKIKSDNIVESKIVSHPLKIAFVLENLLSNATDAVNEMKDITDKANKKNKGGNKRISYNGQITVSLDELNGKYVLRVTDNGVGMHRKTLKNGWLYKKGNTMKGDKGTGTGMYLVKTILDEMGATIEIDSKRGHGTEIKIIFKADKTDNSDNIVKKTGGIDFKNIDLNLNASSLPAEIEAVDPIDFEGFGIDILSMNEVEDLEKTLLAYAA